MDTKKLVLGFVTLFAVSLVAAAVVIVLWNLISHGAIAIDRGTSFRFAVILGIISTRAKSREIKEKHESQFRNELPDPSFLNFLFAVIRIL